MQLTRTLKALAAGLTLALAAGAHAQDKPPIRLLVGFSAGGSTDTIARLLADKLRGPLGQSVIVENKPGAGGRLAAAELKASAPDGLTYMVAPNATGVFQALLYPVEVLKYDLTKDLAPVAMLVSYPMAMAVNTNTGVNDAKQYVAWVKAHPDKAVFGSAGLGGQTHFTGLQLANVAGIKLTVVPYKGNGPLITDLLGGQVPAGIMTAGDILPQQRGGKVKVIGVFGDKRSPLMPDVPTFVEQGLDVNAGDAWTGMWAPAKTPKAERERMQAAVEKVLAMPEVRAQLERQTLHPDFRPGPEVARILDKELAYWGPVIKASGFTPDR